MIEILPIQLLKTEEEKRIMFKEQGEDYVLKKMAEFREFKDLYKKESKDPQYYAQKSWEEVYPDFEKFSKIADSKLSSLGQQHLIDKVNELTEEVNRLKKIIDDYESEKAADRIINMAKL